MWLMTRFGFFSIVRKKADSDVTVRGRCRKDLELLREKYLPAAGEIVEHAGSDYPCRFMVLQADLAEALKKVVLDIDYDNFKECVTQEQGYQRAGTYIRVWESLLAIEDERD